MSRSQPGAAKLPPVIPVPLLRGLWLGLAGTGACLWLAGPASQSRRIPTICRPARCAAYQLDVRAVHLLTAHGITPVLYAAITVVVLGVLSVIWYSLAGLIIWRRPRDRGAVLAAFFLVLFPLLEVGTWIPSAPSIVRTGLPAAGISVLLLFCLLFPNGAFEPRWSPWLVPVAVIGGASAYLPNPGRAFVFLVAMATVGVSQLQRYRAVSSPTERQQTKWALLGVVAALFGFAALGLGSLLVHDSGPGSLYLSFANAVGLALASSSIPITIAVAVLRYRLWNIDRVINLALVYATLTVALGSVYAGGILGMQAIFQLFAGKSSNVAVALSTLAVAALFGPARRRVQTAIDRRFYRGKYDAARTLAAFGDRLRHEVDLANLSRDLTAVVYDTLHPAQVTLWLRDDPRLRRSVRAGADR